MLGPGCGISGLGVVAPLRLAMSSLALLLVLASLCANLAESKCPAEYGYMCMAGNMGKRGGERYAALAKLFGPVSEGRGRGARQQQGSLRRASPSWDDYRELVWRLTGLNRRESWPQDRVQDNLYQDY